MFVFGPPIPAKPPPGDAVISPPPVWFSCCAPVTVRMFATELLSTSLIVSVAPWLTKIPGPPASAVSLFSPVIIIVADLFSAISIGLPLYSSRSMDTLFRFSVTSSPVTTIRLFFVLPVTVIFAFSCEMLYSLASNAPALVEVSSVSPFFTLKVGSTAQAVAGNSDRHRVRTRARLTIFFFIEVPPSVGQLDGMGRLIIP